MSHQQTSDAFIITLTSKPTGRKYGLEKYAGAYIICDLDDATKFESRQAAAAIIKAKKPCYHSDVAWKIEPAARGK